MDRMECMGGGKIEVAQRRCSAYLSSQKRVSEPVSRGAHNAESRVQLPDPQLSRTVGNLKTV